MTMTYGGLLETGSGILKEAGIENARMDAEWLLLAATGKTRSFLFVHSRKTCDEEQAAEYFEFIKRRRSGEPVQYITGSQEFMGLSFDVNPSVLIPRQDTETLVEAALAEAQKRNTADAPFRILDLCCGSGAIAVSVAHNLSEADVTAADISDTCLATARHNAEKNGTGKRITFLKTDMFSAFKELSGTSEGKAFDMILCNPPYIPTDVIQTLQKEVAKYEPSGALDGGTDGLHFYRILAREAWQYMTPRALLMMEIGHDQAEPVCSLLRNNGHYTEASVLRDLAGKDRVVSCRKREIPSDSLQK